MRIRPIMIAAALLAGCSAAGPGLAEEGGTLLVANKRADSLWRIDLASGQETHRTDTCANPHELAVSPDREHVALACYDGTHVEIFRTSDLGPVKRIELGAGAEPHGIVWHPNGRLVASAEGRGSIFVIDDALGEDAVVREIGGEAPGPHLIALDAGGEVAWGTIIPTGTVVRYDLAVGRETARATLGGQTEAIALSSDGAALWVGANAAGKVFRLHPDTLAVEGEVTTGAVPIRLAAAPRERWIVSSDFGAGGLSVIDGQGLEVARTVRLSGEPDAAQVTLVFSDDGSRLYAAETARNTIAEIDFATGEVLRRLPTGEGGDGLAVFR